MRKLPKVHLSFANQTRLLSAVVALADDQEELASGLEKEGFNAFRAWNEFVASFCECGELDCHRKYKIEEAKVRLGSPDGLPGHLTGTERAYVSPLIVAMRRERDAANGIPYAEITGTNIWKRYIDPCVRRRVKLEMDDPSVVRRRREEMEREFTRRRVLEISRHSLNYSITDPLTPEGCVRVFQEAMESSLVPLGFCRDKFRSSATFPVFSKPLTDEWDLCFSPESESIFRLLPRFALEGMIAKVGISARLYVCTRERRKSIDIPIGFNVFDVVLVRHDLIVPGFSMAYSHFADFRELHTIISAHTTLYKLVRGHIEKNLANGLVALGRTK